MMRYKKRVGYLLFIALGLCSIYSVGYTQPIPSTGSAQSGDTQLVAATGIGALIGGDRAKARDDAIQDALRKVVEQAVGTMIASETLVENAQVLSDKIYSKTSGYIQHHEIVLGSEKIQPDAVEITVQARVKLGSLEQDLEGIVWLLRGLQRPRTMVLMEEQNFVANSAGKDTSISVNTAESVIRETFVSRGFDVVDQATVKRNIARDKALAAERGDVAAARALGLQFEAEVIVVGKAIASQATLDPETARILGGMKSYQANITGTAIRVDTGSILAQMGPMRGKAVHINSLTAGTQAIQNATAPLADGLMKRILVRWQAERTGTTMVNVRVHKVSFAQLRDFKAKLQSHIRGVKAVYQRQYTNNEAILDVEMTGSAEALADELASKNLETLTVTITGVSHNRVELEVKSK